MNLFNLMCKIVLDDDDFTKNMDNATSSGEKMAKSSGGWGKSILSLKGILVGAATGAVAVFAKSCIDAAAALEQTNKKTDVIFGDMSDQAKEWALENERTFGAGSGTIQGYLNNIADLTQGMGLAKDASFDMAKGATQLGVQLANWNGIDSATAINDLTSALSGSHEVVAKYGIKLNDASLSQTAMNMGLGDSFSKLDEATKAQVRYQAILDASGNAVDYWNDGNRSMTFYLEEAKEQLGNVKETIGNLFLPFAKKAAEATADMMYSFNDFVTKVDKGMKLFAEGIEMGQDPVDNLAYVIEEVFGIKMPETVYKGLYYIIDLWDTMVVPLFDGIKELAQDTAEKFSENFGKIQSIFENVATVFFDVFETVIRPMWDGFMDLLFTLWDVFNENIGNILGFWETCTDAMKLAWEEILKPVIEKIMEFVQRLKEKFDEYMPEIQRVVDEVFQAINEFWENGLKPAFEAIGWFLENILLPVFDAIFTFGILPIVDAVFKSMIDLWDNSLKPMFQGITDFLGGVFTGDWEKAWNGISSIFGGIWEGLKTLAKTPLNAIIGMVNAAIRGINKISVTIPDWVPGGLGGKSLGFSFKEIEYLEEGGILTKPTMLTGGVMAGEQNKGTQSQAEVVVPLDELKKWIKELSNRPVVLDVDGREFMRSVAPYQDELDDYNYRNPVFA